MRCELHVMYCLFWLLQNWMSSCSFFIMMVLFLSKFYDKGRWTWHADFSLRLECKTYENVVRVWINCQSLFLVCAFLIRTYETCSKSTQKKKSKLILLWSNQRNHVGVKYSTQIRKDKLDETITANQNNCWSLSNSSVRFLQNPFITRQSFLFIFVVVIFFFAFVISIAF